MTLFLSLPRRLLSALGLALVCAIPATCCLSANAAELEGTQVPIDTPHAAPVSIDAPDPIPQEQAAPLSTDTPPADQPPVPPPLPASDDQHWEKHSNNWEQDWEKNLSQAFGDDHDDDDNGFNPALLIPIFAVLFIFGGPIILLILILVFFFGAKRHRQQDINMNIDKLLAAGRDIPVELLRGDEPKSDAPVGSRDKGIRNIFLGTGWLVFLTVLIGFNIGAAGFIWIALGASQVLIWYLNRANASEQAGQQD